jgi:hypothetical protein
MKRKLQMFFSFRKLPKEFADVDRVTSISVTLAILLGIPFFPGRHYGYYFVCATAIVVLGRALGFLLHGRASTTSRERIIGPAARMERNLGGVLGIIALAGSLYFIWTDRDPFFMMLSISLGAGLCFFFGIHQASMRFVAGFGAVALIALSLILYFVYLLPGFLATGGIAAFFAWALLLRRRRGAAESH